MEASITFKAVGKTIGKKILLADLSFGVEKGSTFVLIGKNGWDFRKKSHKKAAWEYIKKNKHLVAIGSPECKMFSMLHNFNTWDDERQKRMDEAVEHLAFVCKIYTLQVQEGRYFIHEHPAQATSWQLTYVQRVQSLPFVKTVTMDQCMYGQYGWKHDRWLRIKKPTKWMTNCRDTRPIEKDM